MFSQSDLALISMLIQQGISSVEPPTRYTFSLDVPPSSSYQIPDYYYNVRAMVIQNLDVYGPGKLCLALKSVYGNGANTSALPFFIYCPLYSLPFALYMPDGNGTPFGLQIAQALYPGCGYLVNLYDDPVVGYVQGLVTPLNSYTKTVTAGYTFTNGDLNLLISYNSTSNATFLMDTDANLGLNPGSNVSVSIFQLNTGIATLSAVSGVVVNSERQSGGFRTAYQGAYLQYLRTGFSNDWQLQGQGRV